MELIWFKITAADRDLGPSKITVVNLYFGPSKIKVEVFSFFTTQGCLKEVLVMNIFVVIDINLKLKCTFKNLRYQIWHWSKRRWHLIRDGYGTQLNIHINFKTFLSRKI